MRGLTGDDVRTAHATDKTAIIFGFKRCAPIEDDIGLIEICRSLARVSCNYPVITNLFCDRLL